MCAAFGDDDVGKTVVNASGEEVGMVTAVEHGAARVKPDPGITDSIKAALGWEGASEETYPLQEESVERVTADEIRLSGEIHNGPSTGTMDTGRETSGGSTVGGGADRSERDRMDESDGFQDDRIGGSDETGSTGPGGSTVPDRDVAGRRDESGGRGEPEERPMDTDRGTDESIPVDTERHERQEGTSENPRQDEASEAMDPDVGDGDASSGPGDDLTDADREIRRRDTDTDDDTDRS